MIPKFHLKLALTLIFSLLFIFGGSWRTMAWAANSANTISVHTERKTRQRSQQKTEIRAKSVIHDLARTFRFRGAVENHGTILIWGELGRVLLVGFDGSPIREVQSSFIEIDQVVLDELGFLVVGRTSDTSQIALLDLKGTITQHWNHDRWSSAFSRPACRVAMGALGDLIHLHRDGSQKVLRSPQTVPLTHNPLRYVLRYSQEQRIYCSTGDFVSKSGRPRGECRSYGSHNWSIYDYWSQPPIICGSFLVANTVLGSGKQQQRLRKVWSIADGSLLNSQILSRRSGNQDTFYCSKPGRITLVSMASASFDLPNFRIVTETKNAKQRCPKSSRFSRRLNNTLLCIDRNQQLLLYQELQ